MHEEKVKVVLELEQPMKISQFQTCLGILVCFSVFIPYYALICAPLLQLLYKGAKWEWTKDHKCTFEDGKLALASAHILAHLE